MKRERLARTLNEVARKGMMNLVSLIASREDKMHCGVIEDMIVNRAEWESSTHNALYNHFKR